MVQTLGVAIVFFVAGVLAGQYGVPGEQRPFFGGAPVSRYMGPPTAIIKSCDIVVDEATLGFSPPFSTSKDPKHVVVYPTGSTAIQASFKVTVKNAVRGGTPISLWSDPDPTFWSKTADSPFILLDTRPTTPPFTAWLFVQGIPGKGWFTVGDHEITIVAGGGACSTIVTITVARPLPVTTG